uniref:H-NS histone family protein n=1 Tax=Orrella sp. TaxID=1921583 RepID=UPI0040556D2B
MARQQNYAVLQAKIQKEIEKLRKQADALQLKKRKPVITSIVRSMKEFDITPDEIVAAFGKPVSRSATRAVKKATPSKRAPVPVKYKHPQTGATWTGRGKPPRWVVDAETSGKSRNDFLV